jgi:hypothetical protein
MYSKLFFKKRDETKAIGQFELKRQQRAAKGFHFHLGLF